MTFTLEQQRAIAIANARARAAEAEDKPERSLLGAIGEGLANTPSHIAQAWHTATVDLPNAVASPQGRATMAQSLGEALRNGVDTAKGYVQQVRDLSPAEYQGSAPRMNTAPAQRMEADVVNKYGVNVSPQRLGQALGGDLGQPNLNAYRTAKDAIAEHPLGTALMVAPFAAKVAPAMLRPVAEAAGKLPPVSIPNPIKAVGNYLDAGATQAADRMRTTALGKALGARQAVADATIDADQLHAADAPLRAAMERAAANKAAAGVGVSDIPEAQAFVTELKGRLNPTGTVVTVPTSGQAKAYQTIIETLSPVKGQKPSLEMVQNLRRELAEAAYGGQDPHGFGAISKIDKGDLVKRLHDIEAAYTEGASTPVRENYAAFAQAREKADDLSKFKTDLDVDVAKLDELNAEKAAGAATSIAQKLRKRDMISDQEYRDLLNMANNLTDAKKKAEFRKMVAGRIAGGIGAGAAGVVGLKAVER